MDPLSSGRLTCGPDSADASLDVNATPPAAPSTTPPATTSVERWARPADDTAVVGDDSRLEAKLRNVFADLGPLEAVELAGKLEGKFDLSAEFKGRLRIDRLQDGSFTVLVEGEATAGVGAPVAGSARVGVAAGTKFHVRTAGEAADLVDALMKGAVVAGASGLMPGLLGTANSLAKHGVGGDVLDAPSRVMGWMSSVSEVKVAGVGKLQLGDELQYKPPGFDFKLASLKATAEARDAWAVDLEKGQLRHQVSLGLAADASASIPVAASVGGNAKVTGTLTTTYSVPPALLAELKAGRSTIGEAVEALGAGALRPDISFSVEVEHAAKTAQVGAGEVKTKARATVKLDPEKVRGANVFEAGVAHLAAARWSIEAEAGAGFGMKASLGVFSGDVMGTRRKRVELAAGLDAKGAAVHLAGAGDGPSLDARRAAASLR